MFYRQKLWSFETKTNENFITFKNSEENFYILFYTADIFSCKIRDLGHSDFRTLLALKWIFIHLCNSFYLIYFLKLKMINFQVKLGVSDVCRAACVCITEVKP